MGAKNPRTARWLIAGLALALAASASPACGGGSGDGGDAGTDTSTAPHAEAGASPDVGARLDASRQDTGMNVQLGGGDSGSGMDDTGEPVESGTFSDGDVSESGPFDGASDTGTPGDAPSGADGGPRPDGGVPVDGSGGRDSATPKDSGTCDPVKQTGCSGNEACTLGDSNQPVCMASGTKTVGETCGSTLSDNCVAGDLCSTDSATGVFTCQEFCSTDIDCKAPAFGPPSNTPHCILAIQGATESLCTVPCNPVTAAGPSGCQVGQVCSYGGTETIPEITSCATGGSATDGVACMTPEDCAAGFACITGKSGTGLCRQVCRASKNTDCSKVGFACGELQGATMFGICCPSGGC